MIPALIIGWFRRRPRVKTLSIHFAIDWWNTFSDREWGDA
jgi:hypothetical protein